jgi:hypothetical protein
MFLGSRLHPVLKADNLAAICEPIVYNRVGQPNTSRGPNFIYRTPSGARYSVSFRRVANLQDMNTVVRIQSALSNSVRTYTVNCKML